jgi:hypothetical protein
MGFSRAVAPVSPPEADTLTEDMAGIGMNLGSRANHRANIENTLFFASEEGMDRADLRVLARRPRRQGQRRPSRQTHRGRRLEASPGVLGGGRALAREGPAVLPPHSPLHGQAP